MTFGFLATALIGAACYLAAAVLLNLRQPTG
jgi:hypothetical protein